MSSIFTEGMDWCTKRMFSKSDMAVCDGWLRACLTCSFFRWLLKFIFSFIPLLLSFGPSRFLAGAHSAAVGIKNFDDEEDIAEKGI